MSIVSLATMCCVFIRTLRTAITRRIDSGTTTPVYLNYSSYSCLSTWPTCVTLVRSLRRERAHTQLTRLPVRVACVHRRMGRGCIPPAPSVSAATAPHHIPPHAPDVLHTTAAANAATRGGTARQLELRRSVGVALCGVGPVAGSCVVVSLERVCTECVVCCRNSTMRS